MACHQQKGGNVLLRPLPLSSDKPLRGEHLGLPTGTLPFGMGTGPLFVGCIVWGPGGGAASGDMGSGAQGAGRRISKVSEGWPQLEPATPSHREGSCESLAATNRLIHNLWSQRKSLLLIIIIRHKD